MLKAMLIRFDYKTVLLRNVPGWPKTQSEMVLSPNDEEVASSKKIIPRPNQVIPFFRPKKIKKKHTLWRRIHIYSRYKGLPPPFSRDAITIHLCKLFNGTSVLLIITTTVLTNKRYTSRRICTENFHNLFIQNFKNWLRSQKFVYNRSQLVASVSLLISACNNDSCFFFIFETLFANETRGLLV